MSTAIRYCLGGRWAGSESDATIPCVIRFQHTTDCEDRDKCTGCLPRLATDGYLCATCHRYLAQWLAAPDKNGKPAENSLMFAHGWLQSNTARSTSSAAREDWQRTGGGDDDGPPLVIRTAVFDCLRLMEERVYIAEERLLQAQKVAQADLGVWDFGEAVARLRNSIVKIEDDPMLVGEAFRKFQDTMIVAHGLAPWRGQVTRVRGGDGPIPCPHCERKTLSYFAGDAWVTCTSCSSTLDRKWFDHWAAMLEGEQTA